MMADDELEDEGVDQVALEKEAEAAGPPIAKTPDAQAGRATRRGPLRFFDFLKACAAELGRVQWPDRRQTAQGTAVTLGFVVIAGGYLGLADLGANELMEEILGTG